MDSNRLRYFLTVCDTGSIRAAAEILRLSPAALSKSLKIFEEELGVLLHAPSGRGLVITDAGRQLARDARPLLEEMESLARGIKMNGGTASKQRAIRIGSFEVFTTHFWGGLMWHLPEECEVLLRELIPGQLESALTSR